MAGLAVAAYLYSTATTTTTTTATAPPPSESPHAQMPAGASGAHAGRWEGLVLGWELWAALACARYAPLAAANALTAVRHAATSAAALLLRRPRPIYDYHRLSFRAGPPRYATMHP